MSMMLESADADSMSFEGDTWEDDYGDAEQDAEYEMDDFGEASRATRRRRQRARQLELQRRRMARARTQRSAPARPAPPAARAAAAIRTLELENRVQDDAFRGSLVAQQRRQSRTELATLAAVVSNQVRDSFGSSVELLQNPAVKAGLNAAPLLFLAPSKKGEGIGGYLSDKRVIGVGIVAALAFIGNQQDRADEAADIRVISAAEITDGDETIVLADVLDRKGRVLQGKNVVFTTDRPDIATIDANGRVTGQSPGVAVITVAVDDVVRRTVLSVKARAQQAGSAKAA